MISLYFIYKKNSYDLFCPNRVIFLPDKANFFGFFFWRGRAIPPAKLARTSANITLTDTSGSD